MPKINFRSPEVILTVLVVFSTLAVWLPFLLNLDSIAGVQLKETGRQVLDRYLYGPLFVVVSKTFYSSESDLYSYFDLPPEYFTIHFPFYFAAKILSQPLSFVSLTNSPFFLCRFF